MTQISAAPKLTRRTMLKATAAAGGSLILNVSIPRLNAALAAESNADLAPNAFVRIDPDGKITSPVTDHLLHKLFVAAIRPCD